MTSNNVVLPPQVAVTSTAPSQTAPGFVGSAQGAAQVSDPSVWPQGAAGKPQPQQTDKNKAMNLPKLGLSPESSPTVSFDDDFDDFQSASLPTAPQGTVASVGQAVITTPAAATLDQPHAPPVLLPEKTQGGGTQDRYAVFREITGETEHKAENENKDNVDESFGEFCSSEVAGLNLTHPTTTTTSLPGLLQSHSTSGTSNASPISFEVYSTPPEALPETQQMFEADFSSAFASARHPDNYADIHEAMKRAEEEQKRKEESNWGDPFGEFEEAPSAVGMGGSVGGGGSASLPPPPPPALSVPWLKVSPCLLCLVFYAILDFLLIYYIHFL